MWFETYPEMVRYLKDWVNTQVDQYNDGEDTLYTYTTPLGMIRRGATYCATANGNAMQSPGCEAALAGMIELQRECWSVPESILYGARPIAFVHDQAIGETTKDQDIWHEQCMRVSEIMCKQAEIVLHHIKMRTEPLLTAVWTKAAQPTYEDGRLVPWVPKETK
jgi:hypothetical protein